MRSSSKGKPGGSLYAADGVSPVPHQYMSAREIKDLRAVLPLEFRETEGQTRLLCSVFSSSSSHSAPVRSVRCFGAEPIL